MAAKKVLLIAFAISLSLLSCKTKKQSSGEFTTSEAGIENRVTVPDITEEDIFLHLSILASDSMQGRMSASPYEMLAAEYIKKTFKSLGLKSFNDNYFQTFPIPPDKYFNNGKLYSKYHKKDFTAKESEMQSIFSQNVVACLETDDPNVKGYIVIGAHYDHIGTQKDGDSLLINNGADDNASGTAGLLEIAEKLCSTKKLKYNIIFVAFGAEELGMIGSSFFCANPPVPIEKIKLMLNMDMIGRMDSSKCAYIATIETNNRLNALVDVLRKTHTDINVVISSDFYLQFTDHSSFFEKHIPVMSFTTGLNALYHTPADTIGSINFKGEKLLLDFIYDLVISPAMDSCIRSFTSSGSNP